MCFSHWRKNLNFPRAVSEPVSTAIVSMSVTNYLKCTLSNNSCPEWPECQHTSRIRIAWLINRTIMIMNHCQTHLWWPTFHSWHWSVHRGDYVETNHLFFFPLFCLCGIYKPASRISRELTQSSSKLSVFSSLMCILSHWTFWLLKTLCM